MLRHGERLTLSSSNAPGIALRMQLCSSSKWVMLRVHCSILLGSRRKTRWGRQLGNTTWPLVARRFF